MDTLPLNRRHSLTHIILSLANLVLMAWLIVIFSTAPVDPDPAFGLHKQQLKILRYNRAE